MKINLNILILALANIEKYGRKKIYNILSEINFNKNYDLNELFESLKLNKKITISDFEYFYKNSKNLYDLMIEKKIDIINRFENDKFNIFKNGKLLKNETDASEFPNQLFIINKNNLNLRKFDKIITIVGTRNCRKDSENITKEIVKLLVKKDFLIVSGLAKGIDTISHQTVIENEGYTAAILGHGLDTIYPSENRELAKSIIKKGMLISEYSFKTKAESFRLVERDRIQTMFCDDIILIESKIDGGSMHAIKWAQKLNKKIWCYDIDETGNKEIIKNFKNVENFDDFAEFKNKFTKIYS